jgi:hypothetical protein
MAEKNPAKLRAFFEAFHIPPDLIKMITDRSLSYDDIKKKSEEVAEKEAKAAEAANKFHNAIAELGVEVKGVLSESLEPFVTEWAKWLDDPNNKKAIISGVSDAVHGLGEMFKKAKPYLHDAWEEFKQLKDPMGDVKLLLEGLATMSLLSWGVRVIPPLITLVGLLGRLAPFAALLGFVGAAGGQDKKFSDQKNEEYIRNRKASQDADKAFQEQKNAEYIKNHPRDVPTQTIHGTATAPKGVLEHNPGNLRFANQTGATGKDQAGFATFGDDATGWKAMTTQLGLYYNRDHLDTIEGIVSKYAPSNQNKTAKYIADVSKELGIPKDQKLTPSDLSRLQIAMQHEETGAAFTQRYLNPQAQQASGGGSGGDPVSNDVMARLHVLVEHQNAPPGTNLSVATSGGVPTPQVVNSMGGY